MTALLPEGSAFHLVSTKPDQPPGEIGEDMGMEEFNRAARKLISEAEAAGSMAPEERQPTPPPPGAAAPPASPPRGEED